MFVGDSGVRSSHFVMRRLFVVREVAVCGWCRGLSPTSWL